MSFVERKIDLTFNLGTGSYGESGSNSVKLSGYRVSCTMQKFGGLSMGSTEIRVYGLSMSQMSALSTLGRRQFAFRDNVVIVECGDAQVGMTKIFEGTIKDGIADFSGAPDIAFTVTAFAGLKEAMKPISPSSYNGSVDVAVVLQNLAGQMGLAFENNGVSVLISSPYLPGTARDQAYSIAQAAGINIVIESGVLAIWNRGQSRGASIGVISPQTGLVGYPSFTSNGVAFRTLFFPTLIYGSRVTIQSQLQPACGDWVVYKLTYLMESQTPNGNWFMDVEAGRPGDVIINR